PQTVRQDGELLAQGRRRRGLAVGPRQQRRRGVLARHPGELVDERRRLRQPDVADRTAHHERVREVVDVLARAREVHQLARGGQARLAERLRCGGDTALDEVLDRLDVVHRLALDRGQLGDLVRTERRGDRAQVVDLRGRQRGRARHDSTRGAARAVAQHDQPLDLDVDALAVQRGLAEVVHERGDGAAVAAVERAERDRRRHPGEAHAGGLEGLRRGVVHGAHSPIPPPTAVRLPPPEIWCPCPVARRDLVFASRSGRARPDLGTNTRSRRGVGSAASVTTGACSGGLCTGGGGRSPPGSPAHLPSKLHDRAARQDGGTGGRRGGHARPRHDDGPHDGPHDSAHGSRPAHGPRRRHRAGRAARRVGRDRGSAVRRRGRRAAARDPARPGAARRGAPVRRARHGRCRGAGRPRMVSVPVPVSGAVPVPGAAPPVPRAPVDTVTIHGGTGASAVESDAVRRAAARLADAAADLRAAVACCAGAVGDLTLPDGRSLGGHPLTGPLAHATAAAREAARGLAARAELCDLLAWRLLRAAGLYEEAESTARRVVGGIVTAWSAGTGAGFGVLGAPGLAGLGALGAAELGGRRLVAPFTGQTTAALSARLDAAVTRAVAPYTDEVFAGAGAGVALTRPGLAGGRAGVPGGAAVLAHVAREAPLVGDATDGVTLTRVDGFADGRLPDWSGTPAASVQAALARVDDLYPGTGGAPEATLALQKVVGEGGATTWTVL